MKELIQRWPELAGLARVELATLPTPVRELPELARSSGPTDVWVKNDGVSGVRYGGNKVRKLELLLGRAVELGRRKVLTFGFAGSNHAAATAVYAAEAGLSSISMLLPQATAPYVQRNLLVSAGAGAELVPASSVTTMAAKAVLALARHTLTDGKIPMIIPPGGSSPLGTVGFVAAAAELAAQIERGELPRPAEIYVAAGTLGTAVGIALGLKAIGLQIPVSAVRVVDANYVNERAAAKLFTGTLKVLRRAAPGFPEVSLEPGDLRIRNDQFGLGYAIATEAGTAAMTRAQDLAGLALDPTYTGKTMAALLADVSRGDESPGPLLFWNTYNSVDLRDAAARVSPEDLPAAFRGYFES